jgi:hypothetical protein
MKHIDRRRERNRTTCWATQPDPNCTAFNGPIERSFDLPFGYRATFIWRRPDEPFEVRWLPELPSIRKPRPRRKFLAAYEAVRREFFEEVGAVLGGVILVVDTDLKTVCARDVIVPPTQH